MTQAGKGFVLFTAPVGGKLGPGDTPQGHTGSEGAWPSGGLDRRLFEVGCRRVEPQAAGGNQKVEF